MNAKMWVQAYSCQCLVKKHLIWLSKIKTKCEHSKDLLVCSYVFLEIFFSLPFFTFLLPSLSSVRVFVGVRWWEKRGALRQESGVFFVFFFFFVVVVVRDARARPRRDGNGQVLTEIISRFFKFLVLSRRSNARASRFYCRCCCCCCSFTFVSSSSV